MGLSSASDNGHIGDIKANAGAVIPANWLECAGQAISRANYALLWMAIGTTFGAGDGTTTFNLPDLRGRSIFGKDNMGGTAANRLTTGNGGLDGLTLGAVGGGETKTLTTAQMPSHNHTYNDETTGNNGGSGLGTNATSTSVNSGNQGGGGAHSVIPPAMVANFIIRVL